MSTEVRVVDPKTGGEKGQKPERYDLIPWLAMDEVARVYAFGAKKYTKVLSRTYQDACEWLLSRTAQSVKSIRLVDATGVVVAATRRSSAGEIQNTPHASVKTLELGTLATQSRSQPITHGDETRFSPTPNFWLAHEKGSEGASSHASTGSVWLISQGCVSAKKASAASAQEVLLTSPKFTLTMITEQGGSEAYYVAAATTASDSLRTAFDFLDAHSGISSVTSFEREQLRSWRDSKGSVEQPSTGDDNWLKGYSWRLSLGALFRHVVKFACREDVDQESGLHHLAHAVFHCLCLITFGLRNLGTDDRMLAAKAEPEPEPKPVHRVWSYPTGAEPPHNFSSCPPPVVYPAERRDGFGTH